MTSNLPPDPETLATTLEPTTVTDLEIYYLTGDDLVRIPIGIEHNGSRLTQVQIDELCGVDEEIMTTRKLALNSSKMTTELLRRVIQEVKGLPPEVLDKRGRYEKMSSDVCTRMYGPDRDTLTLAICALDNPETVAHSQFTCKNQACSNQVQDETHIREIPIRIWPEDQPASIPFLLPKGIPGPGGKEMQKAGTLMFPTAMQQEAASVAQNPAEGMNVLLRGCIKRIGVSIVDSVVMKRMSLRDRAYLNNLLASKLPGPDLDKAWTCDACGEQNVGRVNISGFFMSLLMTRNE